MSRTLTDKQRLEWILSQHWVEPEATFRLGLEDTDDFGKYLNDAILAIDKKLLEEKP